MVEPRDNEIALILRMQRPSSFCTKEAFRASVPSASNIRENWRKNADICRAETLVERNISPQLKSSKKYFITSLSARGAFVPETQIYSTVCSIAANLIPTSCLSLAFRLSTRLPQRIVSTVEEHYSFNDYKMGRWSDTVIEMCECSYRSFPEYICFEGKVNIVNKNWRAVR